MISNLIPLIASFLPLWNEILVYVFSGYFVVFVVVFLKFVFRRY